MDTFETIVAELSAKYAGATVVRDVPKLGVVEPLYGGVVCSDGRRVRFRHDAGLKE